MNLPITEAIRGLTAKFRADIAEAAKDSLLSTSERATLTSRWAKSVIPNRPITVKKAIDSYVAPKIRRAMYAVSADKRTVNENDIKKLRVGELRASAAALFAPKSPANFRKLEAAVSALDLEKLTDYGTVVYLDTYPKMPFAALMEKLIGYEFDMEFSWDDTRGSAGVRSFAAGLRDVGATQKESIDGDGESSATAGDEMLALFNDAADQTEKAFLPVSQFKSVRHLYHGIQEDGDQEFSILLAKKKDDTYVALVYSNFPF